MPKKIDRPNKLTIGALTYGIDWGAHWHLRPDDSRQANEWACTLHEALTILIKPDLAPGQQRSTLLHEIMHTLFAISGSDLRNIARETGDDFDMEEYLTERLEPVLLRFLLDNPKVLKFIVKGETAAQ
jgi:hypothetical protein